MTEIIGENIPEEIINILTKNGYNYSLSMININDEDINEIERRITRDPTDVSTLYYLDRSKPFCFLPGHRKLIVQIGKRINEFEEFQRTQRGNYCNFENASFIMKELIKSMKQNENVQPKGHRYSEALQSFATYIYMLCGKAAYEVLCNNLPLPQVCTICE